MNSYHRHIILLVLLPIIPLCIYSQYSEYVEAKTSTIDNESFGIVKLIRKDNHVKVKYFAASDFDGNTVSERYQKWAMDKKVIAYTNVNYMDNCNAPNSATPIGLCIDQGKVVNRELINDRLDALAIIFATGGMLVSNLDDGDLRITLKGGQQKIVDIRNSAYQKAEFIDWAEQLEATVFQTHLLVYMDSLKISLNSSATTAERRYLAICKDANGNIVHYIINLGKASTLYNAVLKVIRILKEAEDVQQIISVINCCTGCQDTFAVFSEKGVQYTSQHLGGNMNISGAGNLLAYYYD